MSAPEIWCWAASDDSEEWDHAGTSREEALEHAYECAEDQELPPGEFGYISKGRAISVEEAARAVVDVDRFLEQMDESSDYYYAFDEPVFELTAPGVEAEAALQEAIAEWAAKYVTCNGKFLAGDEVEKVPAPVTEEPTA